MSDKEDMIMLILNNLGKEITFDRNIIYDVIEKSTSDYQIKYISNEILTLDMNEKIVSETVCIPEGPL